MTDPFDAAEREILAFNQDVEAWLSGTALRETGLATIAEQLSPDFRYIPPSGESGDRASLVALLEGVYGIHGADFINQVTPRERLLNADGVVIMLYEEHQWVHGKALRPWLSTVVFETHSDSRNGLRWRHVHETWLPEGKENRP